MRIEAVVAELGNLAVGEPFAQTRPGRNFELMGPFGRVVVAERTEECDFGNSQDVQEQ